MHVRIVGLALATLVVPFWLAPPGEEPFRALSFEAACAAAKTEQKVVLIDFFTTWCAPCKKLDEVTWKDEGVRRWLAEKTVALRVDAEREEALAGRFALDAYPSLVFVQPDGKELGRLVGYHDPERFLTAAGELLRGERPSDRLRKELEAKGWNDPMRRGDYADELAHERRYAEALEHYLWCFDHGVEHSPAYLGVRLSFLLGDIAELGEKHPPALAELRQRRDAALAELRAGTADLQQASAFARINAELGESRQTLAVYDELATVEPRIVGGRRTFPRPTLFREVLELLIEDRRYADVVAGLGDAEKVLRGELALHQMASAQLADEPEDMRERLAALRRRRFVEKAGRIYEALAGARSDEVAARVLARILAFDASAETRATLAGHARRAGRPELAASIETSK